MLTFFRQMIAGLPTVATSWQATIGYVALIAGFVVVSLKVTRNKNVLGKLKSLPEKDRARVLQMEMGAPYLANGLSPEQWLQQQRQRYYFFGFLTVCVLGVALAVAAGLKPIPTPTPISTPSPDVKQHAAESVALQLVSKLRAASLVPAYDLFPEDVRRNISFAQFQAETARLFFQSPGESLEDSVEQSVENGAALNVFVTSRFSPETKVRNVVGFASDANGWKLWTYNWLPVEWPLAWPSSTTIRQSASEAMKVYGGLTDSERTSPLPDRFKGNITGSTPGWRLTVASIQPEHDKYQCTIKTTEGESGTTVEMKHVIGGCKLEKGRRILVNALLSAIDPARIELEGVRYFPDI